MLGSFYGGKQGRSYHIVAHYDSIYDMFTYFSKGPEYTDVAFDEYVIIDTILHNNNKQDIENGIIYRRGYNYNESFNGQADLVTHKINRDRSIEYILTGNEIGVPYRYEQDQTNDYGSTYAVTVTIPEFYDFTYTFIDNNTVVIDENSLILNLNKWNQVWNDYVLNPGGGAIYVGQIVGPEGSSVAANLVDWSTFEQVIGERPQETNKGKFFVTPYPGYDPSHAGSHATEDHLDEYGYDEQGFLDVQQYGYCTVRDIQGNITNTFLAFSFPYVIFNIEAQGISAYPTNGKVEDYTDPETGVSYHFNPITRLWEYNNLIKENSDSTNHKFYKHYNIQIPKGVHGQNINELTIKHRGLSEYEDIYDEDGNYLEAVLEHNSDGSIRYDASGNPILKTELTNQYLTYRTKNYDMSEEGALSEINSVSPFRIITNVDNSTKVNSPEVSLENINKYIHNYPKEIVWHYTHGTDTKVDYSIIERIWVQVGDAADPAYDENGEVFHLINNHLYVLYSNESIPRDLGLIKEVEDIWIQAENDPNHPETKEIDDQGNTVKKDYIYTQLTNEIYPHELGFIRKITSITKDAASKDIYINYNYNATGGVENTSEKIPIVEINKIAFNGDLFLLQLKDIEGHEAEYEQTYSYNGEQWINLGNVVRGGKIEAEFKTFDDLMLKYPDGFGYDDATENRAGWLAIVGHDEPIIIHKVLESGEIKKYPVGSEDAIIRYDEQSGTNIIELPEGSRYSDTTDLEIEASGDKRLYGFDYFRNTWVSVQDMGSENVKPEYSLLVAPPDGTGNQPNSINKNQLHINGVWFVEFNN